MAAAQTQPIGKAFIVYGTVKAVAANGTERLLAPNSPIFAGERIVTGPDGSVSVVFNDNAGHLELGRMSDVLMDQDVYAGAGPDQAADAVAQAAEIQAALENGEIDPTTQLPPPAAGAGVAGPRGGGRQIVVFEADQMEVLPDSRFRVTLDNGHQLIAYSGGKMRKHRIRVLAGDKVTVEMSPYDLTRGRITWRSK